MVNPSKYSRFYPAKNPKCPDRKPITIGWFLWKNERKSRVINITQKNRTRPSRLHKRANKGQDNFAQKTKREN